MARRKARKSIDLGKLAAAVARPGIDPRTWVTLARVKQVGFDDKEGFFADVVYLPSGEEQTCMVGAIYAGNGFGFYTPLEEDDIVVVIVPNGDSNAGPVISQRVWNAADKPPADGGTGEVPTADVLLRIQPGKKLKIRTSAAGGDVEIVPEHADGRVKLGSADATRGAARLNDDVNLGYWYTERNGDKDITWWRLNPTDAWAEIDDGVISPLPVTVGTHLVGKIISASDKVKVEGAT